MTFRYDAETDMLYIQLSEAVSSDSEEVAPGIVLDFDRENHVVGVEIEDASKLVDYATLVHPTIWILDPLRGRLSPE